MVVSMRCTVPKRSPGRCLNVRRKTVVSMKERYLLLEYVIKSVTVTTVVMNRTVTGIPTTTGISNNSSVSILSDDICDNSTDCHHGDDENNCRNIAACVREHDSARTYMLANYSRCTPWTLCGSKMDQTNCSDTTLAPLQCPINGYMSTISERIICKRIIFGEVNKPHSNTIAVCEDSMDGQCVTPTSGCYIHKHQLCNNIIDCKDGSDEKSALCNRLTAQECKRKFHYNTSLGLPIWWIGDGVED